MAEHLHLVIPVLVLFTAFSDIAWYAALFYYYLHVVERCLLATIITQAVLELCVLLVLIMFL